MPRPGVDVSITEGGPGGGAALDTGQAFAVGLSERGPVESALTVRTLRDYERWCGPRIGGQVMHDSVRAYFREGGSVLHYLRLAGPNVKGAQGELGPLQVTAASPGAWANQLQVSFVAEGGVVAAAQALKTAKHTSSRKRAAKADSEVAPLDDENGNGNGGNGGNGNGESEYSPVRVVVAEDGAVVERSTPMTTAGQAVAWARNASRYVRIETEEDEAALEAAASASLSGGVDDKNVNASVAANTLRWFHRSMGPGQVMMPGNADLGIAGAVLEHCEGFWRNGLLDFGRSADDATIAADAMGMWAFEGAKFGAALAPWIEYPGPAPGTTVLVPFSAIQAALIARADRQTSNPNQPAAGVFGEMRFARGLGRDFTDDVREELNELGVTLAKERFGSIRTYGGRTIAGPNEPLWQWFGGSRLVTAIAHRADQAAEPFVLRQIDPQRRIFIELTTVIEAIVAPYFIAGALAGETAEEAFEIDTGLSVNTPETIANGEIHVVIRLATTAPAEWVTVEIQKMLAT